MQKYLFFYCILSFRLFAEICEENYPDKIPLFGDLHVHTALSLDAATQGTINRPEDDIGTAKENRFQFNLTRMALVKEL